MAEVNVFMAEVNVFYCAEVSLYLYDVKASLYLYGANFLNMSLWWNDAAMGDGQNEASLERAYSLDPMIRQLVLVNGSQWYWALPFSI
jgi:hypothetical protein